MRMHLAETARLLGGALHGADAPFAGVSTDSRTVAAGELFVALRGPSFDGHDFLATARARGAAGALVEHAQPSLPCVVVDDARRALGRLAGAWRARMEVDTVAITGSNGKTTVKEMVAAILAQDAPVLATRGNLNNDIGVPLTLARLDARHRRLVVEMGANHRGEIAALAALARPRVGVITLIAPAHLEGFGSIEGVARAKGELFEALPADGVAVVNADGSYQELWRALAGARERLRFGFDAAADVRVQHRAGAGGSRIRLDTPHGALEARLRLAGRHNAANAAAATAAALAMGVSLECVRAGLESMRAVRGRLELRPGPRGARLLDDSYNANPDSLRVALEVLAGFPSPRWLVLGDMAELGAGAPELHREAGRLARALGADRLLALGALAGLAADAFGAGGERFESRAALARALDAELGADATVLIKGSRSMAMERVVRALLEGEVSCC